MREDMSKVVIERPRYGHSLPSRKTALRIKRYDLNEDYDDLPKRISGSRNKHLQAASRLEVKSFSDLLGPLIRFLRSSVGCPWDDVYSELSRHLDKRKTTGRHVFEHVEHEVKLHCFSGANGRIYYLRHGEREEVYGLYVHPRTRLLCWSDNKSPGKKKSAVERERQQHESAWRIRIGGKQHYVKLKGIWYVAEIEAYRRSQSPPAEEAKMTLVDEKERWGVKTWRVLSKRQCGKKEMKAAGLSNDRPA